MFEGQQSLLVRIKESRARNKQAELTGNSLIGEITRKIIVNMDMLLPVISSEAKNQAMSAFLGTDEKIQISINKVWEAVDATMNRLKIVNPELADMIETYDADQRDERPVAYFFTMFMATMAHESTPKTGK
jgi:hypothetical protein